MDVLRSVIVPILDEEISFQIALRRAVAIPVRASAGLIVSSMK